MILSFNKYRSTCKPISYEIDGIPMLPRYDDPTTSFACFFKSPVLGKAKVIVAVAFMYGLRIFPVEAFKPDGISNDNNVVLSALIFFIIEAIHPFGFDLRPYPIIESITI